MRLRRYVEENLLVDGIFICPHFRECRTSRVRGDRFLEGQMSHVGRHYDVDVDGRPLRIAVVGQEIGWPKSPQARRRARRMTLEQRSAGVHDITGLERRYYADTEHMARNPHMRGTTTALRVVFGKGPGVDHENEFVQPLNGRPFHIFDGFALVNRLLCSAGPIGSSQGRSTGTMRDNCLTHFQATLRILEPTLVILQGHGVDVWTRAVFPRQRSFGPYLHRVSFSGNRLLLCTFSHPSARGALRWGDSPNAPYVRKVVAPTLLEAIRRL